MRTFFGRPALAAAGVVAAAGILAGGLALRPAFAVGGLAAANPFGTIKCNNGNPCQTYSNKGIGAGVEGDNTNSSPFSSGVIGSQTKYGNGVSGFANAGAGINGRSTSGTGVSGSSSSSWGVYGYSSGGIGIQGQSVNNIGIEAYSSGPSPGLQAASGSGDAIDAIAGSSGSALRAFGGSNDAIDAYTSGTGVPVYASNSNGDGAAIAGTYIGIVGRAPAGTGTFPIDLTDSIGNNVFYVNGNGDVFYHGTLNTFSKTRNGNVATAYGSKTTSPTVEDNGTARLVGGEAIVQLGKAFANTIDLRKAYQVMLTPDGDTRGLYVASKSPTAFVVREVQGGRGAIDFDYHIYATSLGDAGKQMVEMTPAQATSMMPRARITRPIPKPISVKLRNH